ncbi:alpha/beta hydrolase [Collinsella vaginalis]|uniref:alpha/beta hydrolase n=1 Tax=Collinsella vaginalis TaxID=1870987 RepID=UPI000A27026C|nr:alpha/beta hydrolase [Collinsella vaginalis]
MVPENVTLLDGALGATVHPAAEDVAASGIAIIYLHGGGFLYGERDDLPEAYIRQITGTGHALVALDYPLAPECPLPRIVDVAEAAVGEVADRLFPVLGCSRYALFGRSAGGYLALMVAARLARRGAMRPFAIWDFYGYYDLRESFVASVSPHYAAMPPVSRELADRLAGAPGSSPAEGPYVTAGPKATRFGLYVHARQTGRWPELLGVDLDDLDALSLTAVDIAALPPLFITASTGDEDVPLGVSKRLARTAPRARMHQVYYLEHDFDRDTTNPAGVRAYAAALAFLDEIVHDDESAPPPRPHDSPA